MKKSINKNNDKIKESAFLIYCPVCGFSFKAIGPRTSKKVEKCPMCGHKFKDPNIIPQKPNDVGPRTF